MLPEVVLSKACLSFIFESSKSAVLHDLKLSLRVVSMRQRHLVVTADIKHSLKCEKTVFLVYPYSSQQLKAWLRSSRSILLSPEVVKASGSPNGMCQLWGNSTLLLKLGAPLCTNITFLC